MGNTRVESVGRRSQVARYPDDFWGDANEPAVVTNDQLQTVDLSTSTAAAPSNIATNKRPPIESWTDWRFTPDIHLSRGAPCGSTLYIYNNKEKRSASLLQSAHPQSANWEYFSPPILAEKSTDLSHTLLPTSWRRQSTASSGWSRCMWPGLRDLDGSIACLRPRDKTQSLTTSMMFDVATSVWAWGLNEQVNSLLSPFIPWSFSHSCVSWPWYSLPISLSCKT